MAVREIDEAKLEEFIGRVITDAAATAHAATVVLGDRLGLYKALAEGGPQTAEELAAATGCNPRLVREWAAAQAASEYCGYDPETERFSLDPEQAAVLATEGEAFSLVSNVSIVSTLHRDVDGVSRAYSGDAGFGWHDHDHELFSSMARASEADYVAYLTDEWIPALDGVAEKLRSGARVADIGCGYGRPTILLAKAFPASTFHGFDYHEGSIEAARKAAADAGVADRVTFEVGGGDSFPGTYDLICTFDAFHDMGDPTGVARHIRSALAPDGTWMIAELNAADDVQANITPFGRMLYSISSFVCVPNALSQAEDGALGAAAGFESLARVAKEAGFSSTRLAAETEFNLVLEAKP